MESEPLDRSNASDRSNISTFSSLSRGLYGFSENSPDVLAPSSSEMRPMALVSCSCRCAVMSVLRCSCWPSRFPTGEAASCSIMVMLVLLNPPPLPPLVLSRCVWGPLQLPPRLWLPLPLELQLYWLPVALLRRLLEGSSVNAGAREAWLSERRISLPSANSRGGIGRYVVAGFESCGCGCGCGCGGGSWREPSPFIRHDEMVKLLL